MVKNRAGGNINDDHRVKFRNKGRSGRGDVRCVNDSMHFWKKAD